jgi:ureidoacrylate peracid hydrolase
VTQISVSDPTPDGSVRKLLHDTRSALLVVDMQADFCSADGFVAQLGLDPTPCREIVSSLQELIDGARDNDVPVLWVLANYDDDLVPPTFLRRKNEAGISHDCCIPGTEGFEFFGVTPADGEPKFIKHSYSAFTNPEFEKYLRSAKIETLVFSGVQTNVCIEATLREAYNRGFHVVVAEDCVASHTPSLHEATLQNVRVLLGNVTSAAGIRKAWRINNEIDDAG